MNLFERNPGMFANGKFDIFQFDPHHERRIKAEDWGIEGGSIVEFTGPDGERVVQYPHIPQIGLIARPISSITDEEIKEIKGIKWLSEGICGQYRQALTLQANHGRMPANWFFGLIQHGIYPGDQEDFESMEIMKASESNHEMDADEPTEED